MSEIQCAFCSREFGSSGHLFEEWGEIRWESPSSEESLCGRCWARLEKMGLIPVRPGPKIRGRLATSKEMEEAAKWDEKYQVEMRLNEKRLERDMQAVLREEVPTVRAFIDKYQKMKEETLYEPRTDPNYPPLIA